MGRYLSFDKPTHVFAKRGAFFGFEWIFHDWRLPHCPTLLVTLRRIPIIAHAFLQKEPPRAMYNTIDYAVTDRVLLITLNRPDNLNAFTTEMANELIDAVNRAGADDDVRAIIVTGAGKNLLRGHGFVGRWQCIWAR